MHWNAEKMAELPFKCSTRNNWQQALVKSTLQLCWCGSKLRSSLSLVHSYSTMKHLLHTIKNLPSFKPVLQKIENKSSVLWIINEAGRRGARVTKMLIIHWLVLLCPLSIHRECTLRPELICYDLYLSLRPLVQMCCTSYCKAVQLRSSNVTSEVSAPVSVLFLGAVLAKRRTLQRKQAV